MELECVAVWSGGVNECGCGVVMSWVSVSVSV